VGFIIHHLVRHDTVEIDTHLKSLLPTYTPPYQPEITTIWAGPPNSRKGVGILKIYTDRHNVTEVSKRFERTFNNIKDKSFISKEFFDSLEPMEKSKYIESQIEYQKKIQIICNLWH
jgi:hypothetical protein